MVANIAPERTASSPPAGPRASSLPAKDRALRFLRRAAAAAAAKLPAGGGLDASAWSARHRGITLLLWAHALAIPWVALARGSSLIHGLAEASVVAWLAVGAELPWGTRLRSASATVGLMVCSAIGVHLFAGLIEAHFHFFVMVAVVALYQAWAPFLLALAFVVVHHGGTGLLVPQAVYNHQAAYDRPILWGFVHGGFILAESVACLVYWRASERAVAVERETRVTAEAARQDLADAQALANIGSWDFDVSSNVVTWSDQLFELTGADPASFAPSVDTFLQLTHPEDRARITRLIDRCVRTRFETGL